MARRILMLAVASWASGCLDWSSLYERPDGGLVTFTYVARMGFSGTQGANGWSYLQSTDLASFANMTYDRPTDRWYGQGSAPNGDTMCFLSSDGGGPDAPCYAVRRWTAPGAGTVQLVGHANTYDTTGGDGTVVEIRKGRSVLWTQRLPAFDSTVYPFDLTDSVVAGDGVDFIIGNGGAGNFAHDYVTYEPTVILSVRAGP